MSTVTGDAGGVRVTAAAGAPTAGSRLVPRSPEIASLALGYSRRRL